MLKNATCLILRIFGLFRIGKDTTVHETEENAAAYARLQKALVCHSKEPAKEQRFGETNSILMNYLMRRN